MMKYPSACCLLLLMLLSAASFAQAPFEGDWEAKLRIQGMELPLIIHLSKTSDGYTGSFDSPKQQAFGVKFTSVTVESDELRFSHQQAGLSYRGRWMEGDSIVGNFSQGGMQMPLTFYRHQKGVGVPQAAKRIRPQTPSPPFPYQEKQVKIKHKAAGLSLAATLSIPQGKGPFPAVVLISGSGPQNRNSEVFEHEPFWVLADRLARQGIAVLRYDDRGVAQSTGDFNGATSEDFASDAVVAWSFLRKQKKIDPKRTGLIGHSEGGMIAPLAYGMAPDIGFLVLLAGVGIPVRELLLEQLEAVAAAEGIDRARIDSQKQVNRSIFGWLCDLPEAEARDSLQWMLNQSLNKLPLGDVEARQAAEAAHQSMLRTYFDPWFLYFIRYNPEPALAGVKCPVLALNGSKDVQVLAESNLAGIKQSLSKAGNERIMVRELEGLNHLFQPAESGAVSEYADIDITFDEASIQLIADWIKHLK
ncbi:MAG: alpha/beta hydrolase family protein [Bacteroidia bacterium]